MLAAKILYIYYLYWRWELRYRTIATLYRTKVVEQTQNVRNQEFAKPMTPEKNPPNDLAPAALSRNVLYLIK